MTQLVRLRSRFGSLPVAVAWLGLFHPAPAQTRSPSELIDFLRLRGTRLDKVIMMSGIFGCGQAVANLEAARALVELGPAALSEVEKELAAFDRETNQWGFGRFYLELVYARLLGPAAFPRLRKSAHRSRIQILLWHWP